MFDTQHNEGANSVVQSIINDAPNISVGLAATRFTAKQALCEKARSLQAADTTLSHRAAIREALPELVESSVQNYATTPCSSLLANLYRWSPPSVADAITRTRSAPTTSAQVLFAAHYHKTWSYATSADVCNATIFEDIASGEWLDIRLTPVKHRTVGYLQKCEMFEGGLRVARPLEVSLSSGTFKSFYDHVVMHGNVRVLRSRIALESLHGIASFVGEPEVVCVLEKLKRKRRKVAADAPTAVVAPDVVAEFIGDEAGCGGGEVDTTSLEEDLAEVMERTDLEYVFHHVVMPPSTESDGPCAGAHEAHASLACDDAHFEECWLAWLREWSASYAALQLLRSDAPSKGRRGLAR